MWKLASPKTAENSYTTQYDCSDEELREAIDEIVRATQYMSKKDVGALIVIAPDNVPEQNLESGTRINANLSCSLIECLFNTKAPLHDGALVIEDSKILAAACILPLPKHTPVDSELGTRHRAAVGLSEVSDAVIIVVSEETGIISVAVESELKRGFTADSLRKFLVKELIRDKINYENK
jgi:diadenylate cyclase